MKSVAEIRKQPFIDTVGQNCYCIGTSIGLFNSIWIAVGEAFLEQALSMNGRRKSTPEGT